MDTTSCVWIVNRYVLSTHRISSPVLVWAGNSEHKGLNLMSHGAFSRWEEDNNTVIQGIGKNFGEEGGHFRQCGKVRLYWESKDVPGVGKPCSFEQKAEGAGVHGQKMCKFRTAVGGACGWSREGQEEAKPQR